MAEPKAPNCAFEFSIETLRLGEFDLGGVLYHANYYHVYEMAREAFLKAIGVPYSSLVENNEHLAIVESQMSFFKPIHYGQPLSIKLWLSSTRKTSTVFNYEIIDSSNNSLLHQGLTKHVFVKLLNGNMKPTPFRTDLLEGFGGHSV